jgi:hypothetical protein
LGIATEDETLTVRYPSKAELGTFLQASLRSCFLRVLVVLCLALLSGSSLLPAWKQICIPKEIACTREVRPQATDAKLLNVVLQHGTRRRNNV